MKDKFERGNYDDRTKVLEDLAENGYEEEVESLKENHCSMCLGAGTYEELFAPDDIREVRCHCLPKEEENNY